MAFSIMALHPSQKARTAQTSSPRVSAPRTRGHGAWDGVGCSERQSNEGKGVKGGCGLWRSDRDANECFSCAPRTCCTFSPLEGFQKGHSACAQKLDVGFVLSCEDTVRKGVDSGSRTPMYSALTFEDICGEISRISDC